MHSFHLPIDCAFHHVEIDNELIHLRFLRVFQPISFRFLFVEKSFQFVTEESYVRAHPTLVAYFPFLLLKLHKLHRLSQWLYLARNDP